MSSAGHPPSPPRPSVFISYASEDRAAARLLRDALAAAGLEVWYDENELTGGDAWDQKIRRQIRDCDYFMPVISATTERRKEGYFRREWRLAAERTLDMADDVLFLLPVVIDGTSEAGARVPDKFVSVQWLRVPGGQRTPALDALAQRLLGGEHHAPARPPLVTRAPASAPASVPPMVASPTPPAHVPPPMPPFPHPPEGGVGHWIKFFAEILWWIVSATWLLFMRLPRWVRWLLGVWAIFTFIGMCRSSSPRKPPPPERPATSQVNRKPDTPSSDDIEQAVRSATAAALAIKDGAAKNGGKSDWGRIGEEMARRFGQGGPAAANAAGKPLVLVPFGSVGQDKPAEKFADAVFAAVSDRVFGTRPADVAVNTPADLSGREDVLANTGRSLGAGFVLGGRVTTDNGAAMLAVQVIKIADGSVAWHGEFPLDRDPKEAAAKIADAALAALPPAK